MATGWQNSSSDTGSGTLHVRNAAGSVMVDWKLIWATECARTTKV